MSSYALSLTTNLIYTLKKKGFKAIVKAFSFLKNSLIGFKLGKYAGKYTSLTLKALKRAYILSK